jgi:predicted nucleic acid-binding protein
MTAVVLDTGALIGFERNDRRVVAIIARALHHHDPLLVPAGVVAQAWRDGGRQTRLARLLGSPRCEVLVLDDLQARAAGQVCGVAKTADVVDASVAVAARDHGAMVLTSDPDDLRRLDSRLDVVTV